MESYRIKEDVPMPQFSVSLDKVVEKLRLEVVYTPTELKNIPIYTADVNRPGLLLTGYDEYFDPTRIQIFGNAEVGYLTTLPESERRSHIHSLFAAAPPAVIVTRSIDVFAEMMESTENAVVVMICKGQQLVNLSKINSRKLYWN